MTEREVIPEDEGQPTWEQEEAAVEPDGEPTVELPSADEGEVDPLAEDTIILPDGTEPTVSLPDGVGDDLSDHAEPTVVLDESVTVPEVLDEEVVDASTGGTLYGPMRILTLGIAVGWLVLAVFGFVAMTPPVGWAIGGVALVGAAITGWMGSTMVVRWDAAAITLPGRGPTPWSEIDEVALHSGLLSVPQVELQFGRGIQTIPLDALAWFGKGGPALRLAQQVADQANAGEVRVTQPTRRRATRSAGSA